MVRASKPISAHTLHEKLLRPILGPLLLAIGIFYFSFHALSGERGLYALLKENRKLDLLNSELHDVTMKRKDLEHRVSLLSDGSLDLDLLDEQSRIILNDAAEDEVVVPITAPSVTGTDPHAN
jgi:cell division protein FtsB